MRLYYKVLYSAAFLYLCSCATYKQNVLFKLPKDTDYKTLNLKVKEVEGNYKIAKNDLLQVRVYTSNGEILIDPEQQLSQTNGNGQGNQVAISPQYLVDDAGEVNLPMVGKIKVDSLTLSQADSSFAVAYNVFYLKCFVLTTCENRRVTVLGAQGGKVIPIVNENITLLEVLALAGGLDNTAKGHNIRLIRGDLKNPEVQVIDLTTIEGMREANLKIQNHDIIYVEPIRRPAIEAVRDYSPILSIATSLLTLILLFSTNFNR